MKRLIRDVSFVRVLITAFMVAGGLGLCALSPSPVQAQNTYVVDSNGDADDANPGDGVCETSGGDCTLRAAIEEANQTSDEDIIEFDIPQTGSFAVITPSEEFVVTEPVTIDGTTSPEYPSSVEGPTIELDGSSLSDSADDGIQIEASDVTVEALGINGFPDEGIDVFPGFTGATIRDCFVGIAIDDGETERGNLTNSDGEGDAGINVVDDAFVNDNLVSGNNGDGILVSGDNNVVINNIVGLNQNEDAAKGNEGHGVFVNGGTQNEIGNTFFNPITGNVLIQGNTISANDDTGVFITGDENDVLANNIGTDGDGTAFANSTGVVLEGDASDDPAEKNRVGSSNDLHQNVISGNEFNGIRLGNGGDDLPADNNSIRNNLIGVTSDTSATLGNGQGNEAGIRIDLGAADTLDANVIGGNDPRGIWIRGSESTDHEITSNYIGTNADGDDLGNSGDGIQIDTSPSSNSGEIEIFSGNVIGHNDAHGVDINGDWHDVTNNYIGTNANGDDLGNFLDGVNVNAADVSVGKQNVGDSNDAGDGNIIGFNGDDGIDLNGTFDVDVRANYVGTNENDADLGNVDVGIEIRETSGVTAVNSEVGYTASESFSDPLPADDGDGNVVAYNGTRGLTVEGDGSTDNSIRGNAVYQNGDANDTDIGIDLGDDGVTPNDNSDDDADSGPNNLQNFPVIEDVSYDENNDAVSITYRVQTATDNATYPLQIDFYAADSEASGEGKTYLGTQEYTSSDARSSVTNVIDLSQFSDVTSDDYFVATATDDDGNTSEFVSTAEQLPVELASFEGTQTGSERVELTWTTASEQNNAGFEVQHKSAKSESWEKLGFVDSKAEGGTTSDARTYRFSAEDLSAGTHQFRLKQRDLDGTPHTHAAIPVEIEMQEALRLEAPAPHPVQTQATLAFAVKEKQETTLRLYNTLGQRVATLYRGTPTAGEEQTAALSASDLSSGTYFLRLQAGDRTETERITIVH
ncbi:MAG: T9SS type A sorting domain-containing protein [Salinibacter sp.]